MKFPAMTLSPPIPKIPKPKRLITSPRTVVPAAAICRRRAASNSSALPSNSIRRTASSPSVRGSVFGLDPGCVYPSIDTGAEMGGRALVGAIVCTAPGTASWMLNEMVPATDEAFDAMIASRSVQSSASHDPSS
jgi:hypothetical protein